MEQELLQSLLQLKDIGIGSIVLGVLIILYKIIALFMPKKNGNGVKEQLQVIGENHLSHIHEAIKDQTRVFQEDHQRSYEVLIQIREGVNTLKEKK